MSNKRALLLFAKPPVAGRVKTRLIDDLGETAATSIHEQLLYSTAQRINGVDAVSRQLWVGFEPEHEAFKQPCFSDWAICEQIEGDLGERMAHAAESALRSHSNIVIVGSDCPVLTLAYINQAFDVLESGKSVVFGPAEDGGYVLIGLRAPLRDVFTDIDWGSDKVLEQSRQRLKDTNLEWFELSTLWDVDRPEDVQRWQTEPGTALPDDI